MSLPAEKIEEEIQISIEIPAQPEILMLISNEMEKESPDLDFIAEKIQSDTSLFSAILKLINSSYFGMRCEITSIKHAITLLGIDAVSTMIACVKFKQLMDILGPTPIPRYWDNSADVSKLSAYLAKELGISNPQEAYALGMFKDVGISILSQHFNNYKQVLEEQNVTELNHFTDLEDKHFHTNHSVVGYYLTRRWGLSKSTREACLYHHDVEYLMDTNHVDDHDSRKLILICKMANHVANLKRNECQYEWNRLQDFILDYLCISELDYIELREEMLDHLKGI